jgi:hypothetical protein
MVVLSVVFWQPLKRATLAFILLHSEGPSEEVLTGLVEQFPKPTSILQRLWSSPRIAQRQFVLGYLGKSSSASSELFRAMESVLLAATADVDLTSRQLAFSVLARTKHKAWRRLALEQLTDPDPAVRILGLQQLREVAGSNDVATCMSMLGDPEPRVVVAAAQVLRRATKQDYGIKSVYANPQFTFLAKQKSRARPGCGG